MKQYASCFSSCLILLLIGGFLHSCKSRTEHLSFKGCTVTYEQYRDGEKELYRGHWITNVQQVESAQRKLAACLCELYIKTKDPAVKNKIIELYNEEEEYFPPSTSITTNHIDSIIKHRKELFDPTIVID